MDGPPLPVETPTPSVPPCWPPKRSVVQGVSAVVVDAEGATLLNGDAAGVRLGLARPLAEAMGARYLTVDDLSAEAIAGAVRGVLPAQ